MPVDLTGYILYVNYFAFPTILFFTNTIPNGYGQWNAYTSNCPIAQCFTATSTLAYCWCYSQYTLPPTTINSLALYDTLSGVTTLCPSGSLTTCAQSTTLCSATGYGNVSPVCCTTSCASTSCPGWPFGACIGQTTPCACSSETPICSQPPHPCNSPWETNLYGNMYTYCQYLTTASACGAKFAADSNWIGLAQSTVVNTTGVGTCPGSGPCTGQIGGFISNQDALYQTTVLWSATNIGANTRGPVGYGYCPIGANAQVCSGNGLCNSVAQCACSTGYGGVDCSIPFNSTICQNMTCVNQLLNSSVPLIFTCEQYDPCTPFGMCYDLNGQAQCVFALGWMGSLSQGTTSLTWYYQRFWNLTDAHVSRTQLLFQCRMYSQGAATGGAHLPNYLFVDTLEAESYPTVNTAVWNGNSGGDSVNYWPNYGGWANKDYTARWPVYYNSNYGSAVTSDSTYSQQIAISSLYWNIGWSGAPYKVNVGYNCLDYRAYPASGQSTYYGGPLCEKCPSCSVNPVTGVYNGVCIRASPLTGYPYCSCMYNRDSSNYTAGITFVPVSQASSHLIIFAATLNSSGVFVYDDYAICDYQICPWDQALYSQPCGYVEGVGMCVTTSNSSCLTEPFSPPVGYTGMCLCSNGYGGIDCGTTVCPISPYNQKMCSGNTNLLASVKDRDWSGNGHGACNMTSAKCDCATGWTSAPLNSCPGQSLPCPITGTCEYRQCVIGPNGQECSGVVHGSGINVCNRNVANPVCQCSLNISFTSGSPDYQNSWWGNACQYSYWSTETCLATSDAVAVCADVLTATCQADNYTGQPYCRCPANTLGTFCQISPCGDLPINEACNGNGASAYPQGVCTEVEGTSNYSCDCNVVDVTDDTACPFPSIAPSTCALFGSSTSDGPGNCEVAKLGCTYNSGTSFSLCNNVQWANGSSICRQNGSGWQCYCPPAFTGTWCQQTVYCGGTCQDLCCPYLGTTFAQQYVAGNPCHSISSSITHDVCLCDRYHTGSTCSNPVCISTGGTNFTGDNCVCPTGSTYLPTVDYTYNPSIEGCVKQCPLFSDGMTLCGPAYSNGSSRCNGTAVLANSPIQLGCDCSTPGPYTAFTHNPSTIVRWTTNATSGACTPYCANGAQDTGSTCICTTQFTGTRCNISICNNNGVYSTGSGCTCTNPLIFNASMNCSTSICSTVSGNYYDNSTSLGYCSCMNPLVPSRNTSAPFCVNPCMLGNFNLTTGTCSCGLFNYGQYCQFSKCQNGTISLQYSNCSCISGTWDPLIQDCNQQNCSHGVPTTYGNCLCNSTLWTGPACNVSACQFGTPVLTNGNWTCSCVMNYTLDFNTGLCTVPPGSSSPSPTPSPTTTFAPTTTVAPSLTTSPAPSPSSSSSSSTTTTIIAATCSTVGALSLAFVCYYCWYHQQPASKGFDKLKT